MKKRKLLFLLFLYSFTDFAQIRNVTLFPNRVDVTGTTVSSAALSGFSAATYDVGNGAYAAEGSSDPYFTIRDREVFDGDGDKIGDLPTYTQYDYCEPEYPNCIRTFSTPNKEIAIVPVPGSCRRFYVIYTLNTLYTSVAMHTIINANDPDSVYIETLTSNLIYPSSPYIPSQTAAIAVSKKKGNGNYDLYMLWHDEVWLFEITGSGITYEDSKAITSAPASNELELSNDGQYLAWGDNSTLYRMSSDLGNSVVPKSVSVSSLIYGIEFHSTDHNIIFVANGSNTLKKADFSSTPATTSNLTLTSGWSSSSQLEKDGQGRIYGVFTSSSYSTGILFHFDEDAGSPTFTDTQIPVYSNGNMGFYSGFALNDQIDGEDYYTFQSTPPMALSSTINSEANAEPDWNSFYNCNAINLSVTTTGDQARIILTKVDVNKDPIAGGRAFSYTSSWGDPEDLNTDLRSIDPNDHLTSNNGYYKLEIQSENDCGDSDSEVWWLQINGTPTPASLTLLLNDSDLSTPEGIAVAPSHTPPGILMNHGAGSYNISNSTGEITWRSIAIEQVEDDGDWIRDIINPAYQQSVTGGVSSLTSLQLNSAVVPAIPALSWSGGQGFFNQQGLSNYYKITVTVGNACGSSSDYSYIELNDVWGKIGYFTNAAIPVMAHPNPFNRELMLSVPEGETTKVSIMNTLGRMMYEREFSSAETSYGTLRVETANFPRGTYIYKMEAAGEIITGTIVK